MVIINYNQILNNAVLYIVYIVQMFDNSLSFYNSAVYNNL